MRKQFIFCDTRYRALRACPWACSAVRVNGGYMCFESASDARLWRGQV